MTPFAIERSEARFAWRMVLPAVGVVVLVALAPLAWTIWESLHLDDLRMPWLGRPFVGLANYAEALADPRVGGAIAHTVFFTAVSVALELTLGLVFAVGMSRATRARGFLRVVVLLPWAIPTVVAALVWRFMFDSGSGIAAALAERTGLVPPGVVWFADPHLAWVPIVLADVWKTTPFVALLLLAGLDGIDPALYEAARIDGAGAWRQFAEITLPLLRPALLVAVLFRTLDALRVFDLVYVLTGGGPGTATEPISLYSFTALLQNLRFGFGSALSVIAFAITFAVALVYIRVLGRTLTETP